MLGETGHPDPPPAASSTPRAVLLKQRRRRRRFIIGITFFLSIAVTMVGVGYVYIDYRLNQIPRVDLPNLVEDQPGEVMNVLLVGSDSRARLEGQDALDAGKDVVAGQRSDTIMVLHIDPMREQAAILSIPRDLYLPIEGQGYSDRVNAAFALGGAHGLIETIQSSLSITINHYVEVDFVGFKDIVDAVGGVDLYLTHWVRDFTSGLDIPKTGCVEVDGDQGLAYVRSRHFEYLIDDTTWVSDPTGDLGRIQRQQDFIRRMLEAALSSSITNPIRLNRLVGIGVDNVTLDQTLSTRDLTTLARRFRDLDPASVALLTLPTTPTEIDGAQVLLLQEAEAEGQIDRINGAAVDVDPSEGPSEGTTPTSTTAVPRDQLVLPADVEVSVLNAEGTPLLAARAAETLEAAGFRTSGTGDTPDTELTTIRYPGDNEAAARLLARTLVNDVQLDADVSLHGDDVVLVIGADWEGIAPGPVAPVQRSVPAPAEDGSTTTTVPTSAVPDSTTTTAPADRC